MTATASHSTISLEASGQTYSATALAGVDVRLGVARALRVTPPAEVGAAQELLAALQRLGHTPPPAFDPLPADPAKLRVALAKRAAATAEHEGVKREAELATGPVVRDLDAATREQLPAWLDKMAAQFAAVWATFTEHVDRAPQQIGQASNDDHVSAYMGAVRACAELAGYVMLRCRLAESIGDARAHQGNMLLVAELPPVPTDAGDVTGDWERHGAMVREWSDFRFDAESTLEKWRALHHSGLRVALATAGDFEARTRTAERWRDAIGTLHSLGGLAKFNRGEYGTATRVGA